ncbi:MAG: type II secretion system secretin GspD [Desulfobacterales bacterium]|nr:type II secretion system secretin GspD [Desulfobacterales bacterium]
MYTNKILNSILLSFIIIAFTFIFGCSAHNKKESINPNITVSSQKRDINQDKKNELKEEVIISKPTNIEESVSVKISAKSENITSPDASKKEAESQNNKPSPHIINKDPLTNISENNKLSEDKKKGDVIFNFDDADIYEVIRAMAEILQINYMLDSNVSGKITLHSAKGLKKNALFDIFFQILEINGLTAVKENDIYKIFKIKDAPRMLLSSQLGTDVKVYGEKIIIQIIPLQFISTQEVIKILSPFISADSTIVSHDASNNIILVDKKNNIEKALKIIESFDLNIFEKLGHRFYELKNIAAEDLSKILSDILKSYGPFVSEKVKFIPIPKLNILIVINQSQEVWDQIDTFIKKIDIPVDDIASRIYIYFVKNGQATELSDLLNNVFSKGFTKETSKKSQNNDKKQIQNITSAPSKPPPVLPGTDIKPQPINTTETSSIESESQTLKGEIKITPDEIRNALIIEAIPRDYKIIENILSRLDVLPRQVLIEVTIAEISLDDSTQLGVEWTYLKGPENLSTSLLDANMGSAGLKYTIGMTKRWTSALSALASQKKVNILSSPSVLASDNKEAKINISTEIPVASAEYKYQAGSDPVIETSIQYRNTGVLLSVTPHINERGLVSMDVNQEVSEQDLSVKVAGKDYPSFYKRSITTSLTVKNSQTIVIGGLIKETKSKGTSGVPLLARIPFIGFLFSNDSKSTSKTELILLITPKVISSLDDIDYVTEDFKSRVSNVLKGDK